MRNFTIGSIPKHLTSLALPTAFGMVTHVALQFVDLYFISKLGAAATAGVNAAGNIIFVTVALNQVLGIGTMSLISHAIGRRSENDASSILNQCIGLSIVTAIVVMTLISQLARPYLETIAADSRIVNTGVTFVTWAISGYALTFPMNVLGSALRGAGVVTPLLFISTFTVGTNIVLAPVLIGGWGFGTPLGVKGAALATSISIAVGLCLLLMYCHYKQQWIVFNWKCMIPQSKQFKEIVSIGLPAGCDFILFFVYTAAVYYFIKDFGASAQAGFAVGSQLLQFVAMPGLAVAYAAGPIVGQNFGAGNYQRVKATFDQSVRLGIALMVLVIMFLQFFREPLVAVLDTEASSLAAASYFLRLTSWSLIPLVLVCVCSSVFQGLGHTIPSLISSAVRLISFTVPLMILAFTSNIRIEYVWHLSVISLVLQAFVSAWLLSRVFGTKLPPHYSAVATVHNRKPDQNPSSVREDI